MNVSPGALNAPPAVMHWHTYVHPLEADATTQEWDRVTCYRCRAKGKP